MALEMFGVSPICVTKMEEVSDEVFAVSNVLLRLTESIADLLDMNAWRQERIPLSQREHFIVLFCLHSSLGYKLDMVLLWLFFAMVHNLYECLHGYL